MSRSNDLLTIPSIEDIKRREFISGVFASALLIACGDDSSDESTPTPEPDRQIEFSFNGYSATIPANPKRVVLIEGRGDLDFALNVGYPIVATGNNLDRNMLPGTDGGPFVGRLPADIELLKFVDKFPDYEQLVALEPDLILIRGNAYRGDFFGNERLQSIAPLLVIEVDRNATWKEDLQEQARILEREADIGPQLAEFTQAFAKTKAEIASRISGKKVGMVVASANSLNIWTSTIAMYTARDLGMDLPMFGLNQADYHNVSAERFGELLGGFDLIYCQLQAGGTAYRESQPTWIELPAVKAGCVQDLHHTLNSPGIFATSMLLEALAEGVRKLG